MTADLIAQCSAELCSVLSSSNQESLVDSTIDFLTMKGVTDIEREGIEFVYNNDCAVRLVYENRNNLGRLRKSNLIIEIVRTMWLYSYIVANANTLSKTKIETVIREKFNAEKKENTELDSKKFKLFMIYNNRIKPMIISKMIDGLKTFAELFEVAYEILIEELDKRPKCGYVKKLYSIEKVTQGEIIESKNVAVSRVDSNSSKIDFEKEKNAYEEKIKKLRNSAYEIEMSLRDQIRILTADKHDLELQVKYAKVDVIRNLICSLTDYGWNNPLGELFLLWKAEDTPERIKGTINNLFMALSSEDIKLTKEKMVGQKVVITEENQKSFDPYKYEELFIGDEAIVCYPGYNVERKVIVKPVVRKINIEEK